MTFLQHYNRYHGLDGSTVLAICLDENLIVYFYFQLQSFGLKKCLLLYQKNYIASRKNIQFKYTSHCSCLPEKLNRVPFKEILNYKHVQSTEVIIYVIHRLVFHCFCRSLSIFPIVILQYLLIWPKISITLIKYFAMFY